MTRNSATVSLPNAPSIQWFLPLIWVALLAMCIVGMPLLEGLFRWVEPDARQVVYDRAAFYELLGRHVLVVGVAAVVTIAVGVAAMAAAGTLLSSVDCRARHGLVLPAAMLPRRL